MLESIDNLMERHDDLLAPYAVKHSKSKGRPRPEPKDTTRFPFQKDKDRIYYSGAFKRTKDKTQVRKADTGDHNMMRMLHELHVAVVGRSIGRRLRANEDLIEAIALGHDLGHTPWGHSGEEALNKKMEGIDPSLGFEHNQQSLRVVDVIEDLNLTEETREGLMKHQSSYDNPDITFKKSPHIEAQIVDIADEVAYTGHDLNDGLRSKIIKLKDVREMGLWKMAHAKVVGSENVEEMDEAKYIQRCVSEIIGFLINDVCGQTDKNISENKIDSVEKVREFDGKLVNFSPEVASLVKETGKFLREKFYLTPQVQEAQQEGKKIISDLFDFYYKDTSKLPNKYRLMIAKGEHSAVVVKDYIAGMTERFAKQEWKKYCNKAA